MDKRILKQIAKEWAKGILLATQMDSFEHELEHEEQVYVLKEVHNIANKITTESSLSSLTAIIEKYYSFDDSDEGEN